MIPKIYIASKTIHAERWRKLRQDYNIISSWIDEVSPVSNTIDLAIRCVNESSTADVLILYCEENEVLKDALVEYGCALGNNKPVYIVGSCLSLGNTLKFHPNVKLVNSVSAALQAIT